MGLIHSPSIVRNGLILHLDAANPKSYSERGKTWTDLSKNQNTGTLQNGPFFVNNNYSVYFDGDGDYLTSSGGSELAFGTGDFTVECWVYVENPSNGSFGNQGLININDYATGVLLRYDLNNGYLVYFNGSYYASSINTYQQWIHLAFTRESGNIKFFVDGTETNNATDSYDVTGATLTIGVSAHSTSEALAGYISNVRVIKGNALYKSNFTPPNKPLTAIANTVLLTCQSNTIVDNSFNNFSITVNGNAAVSNVVPKNQSLFSFDGIDDHISTTTLFDDPRKSTISVWFKTSSANSGKLVGFEDTQIGSAPSYDRHLYVGQDGYVYFGVWAPGPATVDSGISLSDGKWHNAVGVISDTSNTISLYIDGTYIANTAATPQSYSGYWKIGGTSLSYWPQENGGYFRGDISIVSIYDRELSASEISQNYNAFRGRYDL